MVNSSFQLIGSTMLDEATSSPSASLSFNFDMGPLLKWRDLDIDAQTIAIGIRLGGERSDTRLLGRHAVKVIFRKKEIHGSHFSLVASL